MDFIRFNSSSAIYHLVLGFRLSVRCRLVMVWWMANMRSFCFIIALQNFATLENRLTYQCPSSWLVVIIIKKKLAGTWKKYRILVGPNQWQQVCNRSNPGKTGRSHEGADFSWLSSKVSGTLVMWPAVGIKLLIHNYLCAWQCTVVGSLVSLEQSLQSLLSTNLQLLL